MKQTIFSQTLAITQSKKTNTWLADAHPYFCALFDRRFLVEVDNIVVFSVITAPWKSVKVGVVNLLEFNSASLSNLGALIFCYAGAVITVHIQVRHYEFK